MKRKLTKWAIAFAFFLLPGTSYAVTVTTPAVPKGEDLWFVEDHTLPMIAMTVSLPAGSAYDPAAKAGLASFAAALLDEGAANLNSEAYHTALSNRAIRLEASVDRDELVISLVTLKENAKEAYRLLGLALAHPRFDPDAIARVRTQIVASLQQEEEDPDAVAGKAFARIYFAGHPYGHPVSGDIASVSGIGQQDLRDFARAHWVRADMHIAVAGDVDPATLKALLASAFGSLPAKAPPPLPPVAHMGQPGVTVIPMPVPQSVAMFAMPGLMRNDKDFIPAYVANYILGGGGFSSRLMDEVRVKRGLTYGIDTSLTAYRRAGMVFGQVASKRASMRETIQVIRDTIKKFTADGPTDKEMDDAHTYLTGSFPLAFASNEGIAGQLNAFQRAGLSADYVEKRNALIAAVTADDVRRVSKRLFDANALTFVVAGGLDAGNKSTK
jgi:zinc protease